MFILTFFRLASSIRRSCSLPVPPGSHFLLILRMAHFHNSLFTDCFQYVNYCYTSSSCFYSSSSFASSFSSAYTSSSLSFSSKLLLIFFHFPQLCNFLFPHYFLYILTLSLVDCPSFSCSSYSFSSSSSSSSFPPSYPLHRSVTSFPRQSLSLFFYFSPLLTVSHRNSLQSLYYCMTF